MNNKNKLESISEILDLLQFLIEEHNLNINEIEEISQNNEKQFGKFERKLISFKHS